MHVSGRVRRAEALAHAIDAIITDALTHHVTFANNSFIYVDGTRYDIVVDNINVMLSTYYVAWSLLNRYHGAGQRMCLTTSTLPHGCTYDYVKKQAKRFAKKINKINSKILTIYKR